MSTSRWRSGPVLHAVSTGPDHLAAFAAESYDMQMHHLHSAHHISNGVILTKQREGGGPWLSLAEVHERLHAKMEGGVR